MTTLLGLAQRFKNRTPNVTEKIDYGVDSSDAFIAYGTVTEVYGEDPDLQPEEGQETIEPASASITYQGAVELDAPDEEGEDQVIEVLFDYPATVGDRVKVISQGGTIVAIALESMTTALYENTEIVFDVNAWKQEAEGKLVELDEKVQQAATEQEISDRIQDALYTQDPTTGEYTVNKFVTSTATLTTADGIMQSAVSAAASDASSKYASNSKITQLASMIEASVSGSETYYDQINGKTVTNTVASNLSLTASSLGVTFTSSGSAYSTLIRQSSAGIEIGYVGGTGSTYTYNATGTSAYRNWRTIITSSGFSIVKNTGTGVNNYTTRMLLDASSLNFYDSNGNVTATFGGTSVTLGGTSTTSSYLYVDSNGMSVYDSNARLRSKIAGLTGVNTTGNVLGVLYLTTDMSSSGVIDQDNVSVSVTDIYYASSSSSKSFSVLELGYNLHKASGATGATANISPFISAHCCRTSTFEIRAYNRSTYNGTETAVPVSFPTGISMNSLSVSTGTVIALTSTTVSGAAFATVTFTSTGARTVSYFASTSGGNAVEYSAFYSSSFSKVGNDTGSVISMTSGTTAATAGRVSVSGASGRYVEVSAHVRITVDEASTATGGVSLAILCGTSTSRSASTTVLAESIEMMKMVGTNFTLDIPPIVVACSSTTYFWLCVRKGTNSGTFTIPSGQAQFTIRTC